MTNEERAAALKEKFIKEMTDDEARVFICTSPRFEAFERGALAALNEWAPRWCNPGEVANGETAIQKLYWDGTKSEFGDCASPFSGFVHLVLAVRVPGVPEVKS